MYAPCPVPHDNESKNFTFSYITSHAFFFNGHPLFKFFDWSIVDLQGYASFKCKVK